jgi:hypothetical protein
VSDVLFVPIQIAAVELMTVGKIPLGSVFGGVMLLEKYNTAVKPFTTDVYATIDSITQVSQVLPFL